MTRVIALFYGLCSYLFAFAVLLYAICFVSGLGVPKTIDSGAAGPVPQAIAINLVLMAIFASQHSIMARPRFKAVWTRLVPQAVERSTYVLAASAALALLCWQWRPLPDVVWNVGDTNLAAALSALSFIGWAIVLSGSFLIDHFELFGVHQVLSNFSGAPMPAPSFRTPLYYNVVRHPIYLGFLIAFWSTPMMTAGHLLFAAVTTAYVFVGIVLEEGDLIDLFGEDYLRYRRRVSMIVPWRKST